MTLCKAEIFDAHYAPDRARMFFHSSSFTANPIACAAANMAVSTIERYAKGAFFIVQINRRDGDVFTNPPPATIVDEGDGVVVIGRANRAAVLTSLFEPKSNLGARG